MKADNNGWIKLYRDLLKKPIWLNSTPEQKTILITLLLMANHDEVEWEWKGKKFLCKPGQFVTSLETISRKAGNGISIRNIRTALSRFEKLDFLTNESTKTGRLITICNWDTYQQKESAPDKATDKDLTKTRQLTRMINNENNIIKEKLHKKETEFKKAIEPFVEKYGEETCNNFFLYWTEPNKSKTKLRFELEKTWDLPRRLANWARNEKLFNKNGRIETRTYEKLA